MKYTDNDYFYDYLSCPKCNDYQMGYNPYLNGMNMTKMDSYHGTMDFPMYALNGNDECEDDDRDWEYMRFMYSKDAKRIQKEVEEECDKLEYDGSCMYDEYPDRIRLDIIVNDIYRRVKDLENRVDELEAENIVIAKQQFEERDGRRPHWPSSRPSNFGRDDRLRDVIRIIFFNEILKRRRRRRRRDHRRRDDRRRDDRRR